jgi:hypothetical protein
MEIPGKRRDTMRLKKLTITTAFAAAVIMIGGLMTAVAGDNDKHYKDLYELKLLHAAFHQAVSHAGIDADTKAQHLADILALWTDDGTLIANDTTYSGKGVPGTATCEPGSLTLCDFYANVAGQFVLGHNWVSLTPIFTEKITLLDDNSADIYFQCIQSDVNNNDKIVANITFGLHGVPGTGRARKVDGHWLFSYCQTGSVALPTLDVYDVD